MVHWSVRCWGGSVDGSVCRCGRVRELELAPAGIDGASSVLPFLVGRGNNIHVMPESDPFSW